MSLDPVITFRNVSFSYDGPPVLLDVNAAINERDFVCVIGPNGGGKTTLIKLVIGLVKPRKGSVEVLGTSPEQARRRRRASVGCSAANYVSASPSPGGQG